MNSSSGILSEDFLVLRKVVLSVKSVSDFIVYALQGEM